MTDELFNTFFANQCTLLNNSNILPDNLAKLTNKPTDDIAKIVDHLDPNKVQGHHMLSILMIILCVGIQLVSHYRQFLMFV